MKTPTAHSFVTMRGWSRYVSWLVLLLIVAFGLGGCGWWDSGHSKKNNALPVRCLNKPEPGPCKAFVIRYFYDYRYDKCRAFRYGGCRGRVPFKTLADCEKTCVAGSP